MVRRPKRLEKQEHSDFPNTLTETTIPSSMASTTPPRNLPVLPYDILSLIFQEYIIGVLEHADRRPRLQNGPLLLSHVCQCWRDAAFSTPSLWSVLAIDHDISYAIISHYLTHAREMPLHLFITQWSYHGENPDRRVLDLLLSRANKWRSVRILFDEKTAIEFLRRFCDGAEVGQYCEKRVFETLEEATIEGSILVSAETSRKLWSFFLDRNRFPRLRWLNWSLDMNSQSPLEESSEAGVNNASLGGITHLKLTFPPPMAECLGLLKQCPNLQTLSVDFRNCSISSLTAPPHSLVAPLDYYGVLVEQPSSLRELTLQVDGALQGRILSKYIGSYMTSSNVVVHVRN